jgi:hypothetical protein
LTGGLLFPLLLFAAAGLSGCTSSRSPTEIANDRADVLGTWKYRANGSRLLDRGTLQIQVRDGHLTGEFRDRWRGTVRARVMLDGPHMAFTLDRARISGRIRSGRFEGAIRRSFWDASERGNERSSAGYFVAQRIRRAKAGGASPDFGCASFLHESSYTCSPLLGE